MATGPHLAVRGHFARAVDRKSTRLNSSHLVISYAVFCLKKKNFHADYARRLDPRRPVCPLPAARIAITSPTNTRIEAREAAKGIGFNVTYSEACSHPPHS